MRPGGSLMSCAVALVLLSSSPAAAQVAGERPSADARLDGWALAALLDPEPFLAEASVRSYRARIAALAAHDAAFGKVAGDDPSRFSAAQLAAENAIRAQVLALYPEQQRAKADLYARDLSVDDLHAALAYYRSPLGTKVVALGFAALSGATEADRAAARTSAMAQLSDAERDQVTAFARTEAAQRLHTAYGERQVISRDWAIRNQDAIMSAAATAFTKVLTPVSGRGPASRPAAPSAGAPQ